MAKQKPLSVQTCEQLKNYFFNTGDASMKPSATLQAEIHFRHREKPTKSRIEPMSDQGRQANRLSALHVI